MVVVFVFCLQIADLAKYADLPGGLDRHFENTITARYSLDGWGIRGLLGSMWLHGGIMHRNGIGDFVVEDKSNRHGKARKVDSGSAGLGI